MDAKEICPNCMKNIPIANLDIHFIHCQRNFITCQKCKEPVPRTQMDEHLAKAHEIVKCEMCNEKMEKYELESHQDGCSKKPVQCAFCELDFPCDSLNEHENYCGSRTEKCDECGQYVRLKDQKQHIANGHENAQKADKKHVVYNNKLSPVRNYLNDDILVKKTNIHTDLTSRQSPIKRTNDMPQLNTNVVNQRKSPEKTPIHDLEADSIQISNSLPSDEYDRLLALQLQQEDFEDASESHAEISPPTRQTSNSWPDIMTTLDSMSREQIDPFDRIFSDDRDAFKGNFSWSYPPVDQMIRENLNLTNYNDGQIDESNNRNDQNETIEHGLPCEFCRELFPEEFLIQHQSGCCPDIAHGLPTETTNEFIDDPQPKKILIEPLRNSSREKNNDETVLLPCDFCGLKVTEEVLIDHEAVCDENPFVKSLKDDATSKHSLVNPSHPNSKLRSSPPEFESNGLKKKYSNPSTYSKPPANFNFSELVDDRKAYTTNRNFKSDPSLTERKINRPTNTSLAAPTMSTKLRLVKTDPNAEDRALSSTSILRETRQSLQPVTKRIPVDEPDLILTGTRPKLKDRENQSLRENRQQPLLQSRQQMQPRTRINPQSANYVPTYCRSGDGKLEEAYQRFVESRRARLGENSAMKPQGNLNLPPIERTGALPKQKPKKFPEE